MHKIWISRNDESGNVAEVNKNILGALNSGSLSTGKPVDFKRALSYSLSLNLLSIYNLHGSLWYTTIKQIKRYLTIRCRRSC